MEFSRTFAMPSADTFSVPPIKSFVLRHLRGVSVDMFARNSRLCQYTNDINPATAADAHMDAEAYLHLLADLAVKADCVVFDPPYSPRQISECYSSFGRVATTKDTQNAALCSRVRSAIPAILSPGATVLSFGWNTVGMGKKHGGEILEILAVCHGGAHNDTLCVAERMP